MYQLLSGNIFDKKCDLLIIPCNANGGVTCAMKDELLLRGLPFVGKVTFPGDVYFTKSSKMYTDAKRIGYAASVAAYGRKCRPEFLKKIAEQIIRYCEEQELHEVIIPLLGTGAGGMMPKEAFSILRRAFEGNKSIMARIYVLSSSIYEELKMRKKLKIFIGSSSEQIANVDQVACWLEQFDCVPIPWTDGQVFPLGTYTWEVLLTVSGNVDGAIFIFGADDKTWCREKTRLSVRDNVLLEYGLFCGKLSRERVIFLCSGSPEIASDLLGITYADLDKPNIVKNDLKNWIEHMKEA